MQADTPYMYSTYDGSSESAPTTGRKVLILGGGPNRIGQGIEFDYCCCHASFALRYGLKENDLDRSIKRIGKSICSGYERRRSLASAAPGVTKWIHHTMLLLLLLLLLLGLVGQLSDAHVAWFFRTT
jgi:hypothetical protein